MTFNTLARQFLPDDLNARIDAAQLLTDDCAQTALKLAAENARALSLSGNVMRDACLGGAAMMYDAAANSLASVARSVNYQTYGQSVDLILARIVVADTLTSEGGHSFDMSILLGHLRSPLSQNDELSEALERARE